MNLLYMIQFKRSKFMPLCLSQNKYNINLNLIKILLIHQSNQCINLIHSMHGK